MYKYSFEKLDVWVESKELTKLIYEFSSQLPKTETFGLTSQLRRASISICSNIAEGSARKTSKDKAHFTTMAFSSAVEIVNQLIICMELGYLDKGTYLDARSRMESITNKLNALRKHQYNN
ncbi:MAG: four helix bundle protein [Flavobacteriaceae bacterium]